MSTTATAADIKDALHRRYNKGDGGEQYVRIEEARSGAGFDGNNGQCDFLAINTWKSRGMELIGHEVKVSMSDWKAELAQPEKAERFARFCRRWYVAVPSGLAKQIRHEVPPAWGLLSVSAKGRVTEVVPAPARTPEDVPAWWWVGWLAQIDRQHKRSVARAIQDGIREELAGSRERMQREAESAADRRRSYVDAEAKSLAENADALRDATGIDLRRTGRWNLDRLTAAWALVTQPGPDLAVLTSTLRRTADAIEGAAILEDTAA